MQEQRRWCRDFSELRRHGHEVRRWEERLFAGFLGGPAGSLEKIEAVAKTAQTCDSANLPHLSLTNFDFDFPQGRPDLTETIESLIRARESHWEAIWRKGGGAKCAKFR